MAANSTAPTRGLGTIVHDWWQRAKEIVAGVVAWFTDEQADDEDETDADVKQATDDYADLVGSTEVHTAIYDGVAEYGVQQGLSLIWIDEPNACPRCTANAEAGPVPAGQAFPSGDYSAPAHPNCRCTVSVA